MSFRMKISPPVRLIWNPACAMSEQVPATLTGWHRSFCFRITRYRGCDEQPGLMMSLDRGGSCKGVIQRLPAAEAAERLELVDEVAGLAVAVDAAGVVVGAQVVEAGGGVGQQVPDDHQDGAGHSDQSSALADAPD